MCVLYVKDAFLAACSRVRYKKKSLPFFTFCRAHAGYVLVLTLWPGLDTYGSSPAYHKLAHLLSEACVDLCFKRDSLTMPQ